MKTFRALAAFVVGAVFIVIHCNPPTSAGNGSQTPNSVVGMLYEPDGKTPAAGVKVVIRPRSSLADTSGFGLPKRQADTATVTTDDSGKFSFDSTLDTGLYVIEANQGDTSLALIDSVHVIDPDSTVQVEDTLKPAGKITGTILLSEGGDVRKVFILAFGINRFAMPDVNGVFTFDSLAEAEYDLRIISSLDDYGVLDTVGVAVRAGETTRLDTLRLPFTGIPTPRGLKIDYDTMKQIVTLTWERADTGMVKGYNVYRQHQDSGLIRLNTAPLSDTTYQDSTALQGNSYTYQIKALDKSSNEGEYSTGATTIIAMPFKLTASWGGQGTGDGRFTEIGDIVVLPEGHLMAIDYGVHRVQILDSTGSFVRSWGQKGNADGDFTYPIAGTVDDSGYLYVLEMLGAGRIQKFDTAGTFIKSWAIGQYCRGLTYSRGNLFVASTNPAAIRILDPSTNVQDTILLKGSDLASITADTTGVLFVSDHLQSHVLKTDTSGAIADSWGNSGVADGQFASPGDIALANNGNVFVADPNNGRIQIFTSNGKFLTKLIITQIPAGSTEAPVEKRPKAIAFDSDDNLLVADSYFIYHYTVLLK